VVAYAAFVNWSLLLEWKPMRRLAVGFDRWAGRAKFWQLACLGAGFFAWYTWIGNPWANLVALGIVFGAALIGGFYIASCAGLLFGHQRRSQVESALPGADSPVILFDGVCGLCNRWVDFVIAHDRGGIFRFAPLQSDSGKQMLRQAGLPDDDLDSVVLVDRGGAWTRSTAALRIFRQLDDVRWLASLLGWVPRPVRDFGYRLIARSRYRLFGRHSSCRVPSPRERERFIG
jgi:predicted DCC family thiol-disulfide oxidoreductase YuxK